MSHKVLNGLVLKHSPYREADEFLTVWTWEEGKARVLARSVRKPESKLKSLLAPVAWVQVQVVPAAQVYYAVSAATTRSYPGLLASLVNLAMVFNLFELVLYTTSEHEANQEVSVLLRASLEELDRQKEVDLDFLNDFRMRLLSGIGYGIDSVFCRQCGRKLAAGTGVGACFSSIFLGLICSECSRFDGSAERLESAVVEHLLTPRSGKDLPRRSLPREVKLKVNKLVSQMVDGVIERRLNSRAFLAQNMPSY